MNQVEMSRLAAAANALRPDWPAQSVLTLLAKVSLRAYRDAAVAVAYIAADEHSKTPARLLEPGPWWTATQLRPDERSRPLPPVFAPPRTLTDDEREAAALAASKARAALRSGGVE